jgi:hypothetical protein
MGHSSLAGGSLKRASSDVIVTSTTTGGFFFVLRLLFLPILPILAALFVSTTILLTLCAAIFDVHTRLTCLETDTLSFHAAAIGTRVVDLLVIPKDPNTKKVGSDEVVFKSGNT